MCSVDTFERTHSAQGGAAAPGARLALGIRDNGQATRSCGTGPCRPAVAFRIAVPLAAGHSRLGCDQVCLALLTSPIGGPETSLFSPSMRLGSTHHNLASLGSECSHDRRKASSSVSPLCPDFSRILTPLSGHRRRPGQFAAQSRRPPARYVPPVPRCALGPSPSGGAEADRRSPAPCSPQISTLPSPR